MENRHLIAKHVFDLRIGLNEGDIPQYQEMFSRHYWQSIVPGLEKLFDRFVSKDELIRIDRLELNAGNWSQQDILSGGFIDDLLSRLEVEIKNALRGTSVKTQVRTVSHGCFDLWLYFLEHGFLPSDTSHPLSEEMWQGQILESIAQTPSAIQRLRNLLLRQPASLQRLILQYDAAFLAQLLETLTQSSQRELSILVGEVVAVIVRAVTDLNLLQQQLGQAAEQDAAWSMALNQWIQEHMWYNNISDMLPSDLVQAISARIIEILAERTSLNTSSVELTSESIQSTKALSRRIELSVWRQLLEDVLVNKHQIDASTLIARVIYADAMIPWRGILLKAFGNNGFAQQASDIWQQVNKAISRLPVSILEKKVNEYQLRNSSPRTDAIAVEATADVNLFSSEESDTFYLQSAGVILLHPFLPHLFNKFALYENGEFINNASRQRAVYLVNYLATGNVRAAEFCLVLPKFLCGMPLNEPIDHFLELEAKEQQECDNLIRAAIDHWDALGSVSADWLREMFIKRDGKLQRRDKQWQLSVERKAQDILLNRLPHGWGLGVVKLPWMDALLHIDWC